MSKKLCPTCQKARIDGHSYQCLACHRKEFPLKVQEPKPERTVEMDRTAHQERSELASLKTRYKDALKTIARQETELDALGEMRAACTSDIVIAPKHKTGTSEATAIMVASDWHLEEKVGKEVGALNTYNLKIAEERAHQFFAHGLRLVKLLAQDVKIPTIILPLLGDFISNDIHDEFPEVNEETPIHAIVRVQGLLIAGIEFLLTNSDCTLVIPCHSGNHARTTKTTRFTTENGHSLEYFMYVNLATYFKDEPRVTFHIPEGMHSYIKVYDQTVRFQHGHAIKYGGGVGGIYIPVNKAIAQWNKGRHADLDVFGHFHQMRDGGNFICNGSMIGYNAFALSIKADYEPPKQALFLLDKKRGRTCMWPILFTL